MSQESIGSRFAMDRSLGRQEGSDVEQEIFMHQIAQVIERIPNEEPRHLEILEKKLKE